MQVQKRSDGTWSVFAPWLKGEVVGSTWEEAYWKAVRGA